MGDHKPSGPRDSERWKSFQVRTSRPDLPQLSGLAKPFAVTAAVSVFALTVGALGTYSADVNGDASPTSETNASQQSQTEPAPMTPEAGKDTEASQGLPEPNGDESAVTSDATEEQEVQSSEESENNSANNTFESGQPIEEERVSATAVPVAPSPTRTSNPSPSPSPSPSANSNPAVPNLSGLSRTEGENILRELGLRRWASSDMCSDEVPKGRIVYSIPPAGGVLDLEFHNGESTKSYFWFYTSSGVCDTTNYEIARRPNGWNTSFDPGIQPRDGRLESKNIGIVGRWLSIDHEWNLQPFVEQWSGQERNPSSNINLDYGASCTVTVDSRQQLPCLNQDGTRKTSRIVKPGEIATERFLIDLQKYGLSEPTEVAIEFFMDSPQFGYHKLVITYRFNDGWT